MTDETMAEATAAATPKPKRAQKKKVKASPKGERGQSTIAFPYQDLENGISVVRAILGAGGVAVTRDQLAGVMNLSAGSGNFVLKVATARMFGLVNYVGSKYELSPLGFNILDAGRRDAARAEAFLNVPLYKRVYDEFKGRQLPPRPQGLENAFVKFGVAPKQRSTARLVFDKSATQAGFFPNGPDRLIEPILSTATSPVENGEAEEADDMPPERNVARSQPQKSTNTLNPFIQGLLDTLPAPETNWTIEGRATWLQAAAKIFELIYKGSGEITIQAKAPHTPQAAPSPRQAPQAAPTERPPVRTAQPAPDDDIPF